LTQDFLLDGIGFQSELLPEIRDVLALDVVLHREILARVLGFERVLVGHGHGTLRRRLRIGAYWVQVSREIWSIRYTSNWTPLKIIDSLLRWLSQVNPAEPPEFPANPAFRGFSIPQTMRRHP
jgi:hypothetical protein